MVFGVVFWGINQAAADEMQTRDTLEQVVRVLGDSATMHYHDVGWFTTTSGTVRAGGFPDQISTGDTLTAGGKKVTANIIIATEVLEDYSGWGMEFKAGDVSCVIVEREEDLPYGPEIDRLWIHVAKCAPLR